MAKDVKQIVDDIKLEVGTWQMVTDAQFEWLIEQVRLVEQTGITEGYLMCIRGGDRNAM